MAIFSKKKEKKRARQEAARQGLIGATAMESVAAEQARTRAAESARAGVFGLLGAPGTYDLPGAATAPSAGFGDVFQTGTADTQLDPTAKGLLQYKSYMGKDAQEYWGTKKTEGTGERKGIVDPEKYAEAMKGTAGFRIQSRMTAEAEQLLAEKGPLWEKLQQSTQGQIMEGAGIQLRETMRDLKNQAAKGGSARRNALTAANEILARERATQMRVSETWQKNLVLHDYVRKYAAGVQESNERFLSNLPLISQQYTQTMTSLAETMAGTVAPIAGSTSAQAYQARAAVGDSKFLDKLVLGAIMFVGSALTAGAGAGIMGAGMMAAGTAMSGVAGSMLGGGGKGGMTFNINPQGLFGGGKTSPTGSVAGRTGLKMG